MKNKLEALTMERRLACERLAKLANKEPKPGPVAPAKKKQPTGKVAAIAPVPA